MDNIGFLTCVNKQLAQKISGNTFSLDIDGESLPVHSVTVDPGVHSCMILAVDKDGVAVRKKAVFCPDNVNQSDCPSVKAGSKTGADYKLSGELLDVVIRSIKTVEDMFNNMQRSQDIGQAINLAKRLSSMKPLPIKVGSVYHINKDVFKRHRRFDIYGVVLGVEHSGVSYLVAVDEGDGTETIQVNWYEFVKEITIEEHYSMVLKESDTNGIH